MNRANFKIILLLLIVLNSCTGEGYKNIQFYYYSDTKYNVEKDLLEVISTSTDTIPLKWKEYAVPFDFMDDKLIYFKENPEEILRVGFTGDRTQWNTSNICKLSLYGMFKGEKWMFYYDISSDEKERIKKRLETEILSKMRHSYTKED